MSGGETPHQPRRSDVEAGDGTRLAVFAHGDEDGQAVVLCHGIGLDRRSWGELPGRLAQTGLRVIAYDLRGHGESAAATGGDYSFTAQGRDLDAVLRAAVPGGARVVLVGHSLGGGVLLAHVREAGDARVRAAVFVNTSGAAKLVPALPRRSAPGRLADVQRDAWLLAFEQAASVVERLGNRPRVARVLLRRWAFGADPPSEDVRFLRTLAAAARSAPLAATMRATVALDPVGWAPGLRRPALVLAGTRDVISPLPDVRRLADALPFGRLERLEGAGHMAALTRPDATVEQIGAFLDEVADGEAR